MITFQGNPGLCPSCRKPRTPKLSRTAAANRLYWQALHDLEKSSVEQCSGWTAQDWHKNFKEEYLMPIFIRDDEGYANMVAVIRDLKDFGGYNSIVDGVIALTSTTKCSPAQFSEYLDKIMRFCNSNGVRLTHEQWLYDLAKGR